MIGDGEGPRGPSLRYTDETPQVVQNATWLLSGRYNRRSAGDGREQLAVRSPDLEPGDLGRSERGAAGDTQRLEDDGAGRERGHGPVAHDLLRSGPRHGDQLTG